MATIVSFVIKNLAGNVVRTGACEESVFDKQLVGRDETIHIVEAGEAIPVPTSDNTNIVYMYTYPRYQEYPDLREQMDAIWEMLGMSADTMPVKTKLMYDRVMAVKNNFPKGKRFLRKADGSFVPYTE